MARIRRLVAIAVAASIAVPGATVVSGSGPRDESIRTQPGAVQESTPRLALLVGVGEYEDPEVRDLGGPAHDVRAVEALLLHRFGFHSDDVVTLVDGEATRDAMERTFRAHLIERSGPETQVFFFFAGHGSYVDDDGDDERDGLDEVLMTHGSRLQHDAAHDVRDDDLSAWFAELQQQTEHVVAVFDCCHSGTLHRGIGAEEGLVARFVERPTQRRSHRPRDFGAVDLAAMDEGPVFLFACREDEKAEELRAEWFDLPQTRGLFSLSFERALATLPPGARWVDLLAASRGEMERIYLGQQPRILGASARTVFGGDWEPAIQMLVSGIAEDGMLIIDGGFVHGITVGSKLRIRGSEDVRRGQSRDPARLRMLDRVAVVERVVGPGSARARLLPRSSFVPSVPPEEAAACVGALAWLHEHADPRFVQRVELDSTLAGPQISKRSEGAVGDELLRRLDENPFFEVAGDDGAGDELGTLRVKVDEVHGYRVVDATGRRVLPHPPRMRIADVGTLVRDLHAYALWRSVRSLRNHPPAMAERCRVTIELGTELTGDADGGRGSAFRAGSYPLGEDGVVVLRSESAPDAVRVRVENGSANTLYLWIVDLQPKLSINPGLAPEPWRGWELSAGETFEEVFDLSDVGHEHEVEAPETLKVLVAEEPCDLSSLSSSGITASAEDHKPPIDTTRSMHVAESALARMAQMVTYGHRGPLSGGSGGAAGWMTVELEFRFVGAAQEDREAEVETGSDGSR